VAEMKEDADVKETPRGTVRALRPWEPVSLKRLGAFGDALIGGSKGGSTDTGAMGMA
jgi:hypothetical protein